MSLTGKIMSLFVDKGKSIPLFPRTKVKAISDDDGKGLEVILDDLKTTPITADRLADNAKSRGVAVTLTVAGWSSKSQTVSVSGVTASNNVIVAAAPASRTAWNDAEIYCSAQSDGKLTFTCSTVPTAAVTANVVILV